MLDVIVVVVLIAAAVVALLVVLARHRRGRQDGSLAEALAPPPSPRTARTPRPDAEAVAPGSGPYPGSALPGADGSAPSGEYLVKARTGSRRYYRPGSPHFRRVDADVWFRSSRDADAAGFLPADDEGGE